MILFTKNELIQKHYSEKSERPLLIEILYFALKFIKFPEISGNFCYQFSMPPFYFHPKKLISHLLIMISVIISLIGFTVPRVIDLYGFHPGETATVLFVQVVLFQFLHGSLFHLFMNSYFLYSAGPIIESRMSRERFLSFFASSTIFVAVALYFLSPHSNTIGISGFCMALLAYLWIDLRTIRHPMAGQVGFMLLINILLWLSGNISFVWHAAGAVWGIIWWQMRKKW